MPIVHEQTQNNVFSFESEKVEKFYAWLLNDWEKASSEEKMKKFFTAMGIDVSQKKHDSLFIQHQVGLGLRELMKQHYLKEEVRLSRDNISELHMLQTQETHGTEKHYAFLENETIMNAGKLFGIEVSHPDVLKVTRILSQEIIHSGSNDSAHFNLNHHETAGNGNCALNALAQAFAVELGMELTPASPEERAGYIAGTFIPTAPVSQVEKTDDHLQELKSLLSVDQTDLKAIIMDELSLKAEPTDADLKRFIERQSEQAKKYEQYEQHKVVTTTPFKSARDSSRLEQSSGYSPQQAG